MHLQRLEYYIVSKSIHERERYGGAPSIAANRVLRACASYLVVLKKFVAELNSSESKQVRAGGQEGRAGSAGGAHS